MTNAEITVSIVILAAVVWRVWGWLDNRPKRPKRHYPSRWDGTHATCSCGHHSVWDYNLKTHFAEVGRVGN